MTTAMVLCAGFGTRLRPLSDELAKPLMPVGDRPVLGHIVAGLRRGGVDHVVVNAHHRSEDLTTDVESLGTGLQVVCEPKILGTAGGVANAAVFLGTGDVIIWNGDILAPALDVMSLLSAGPLAEEDARWVVEPLAVGQGTVGLDARGNVIRLRAERFGHEASGGNFLGIQLMGAKLRASLPPEGCLVEDVALPLLRKGGRIASFSYTAAWDDVGSPGALLRANLRWLEQQHVGAWCAADAVVAAGVRLQRSIVGAGAVVRGSGELRDCVVFPGTEIAAPQARLLAAPRSRVQVPATSD